MATTFQPPPTYADPVVYDEKTRKQQFNPIWLKWFLDVSQYISTNGGGGAIKHNSLAGLQGGDSAGSEFYHLTNNAYNILGNIAAPTAGSVAYGTGSALEFTDAGSTGQVLVSRGAGTPTWGNVIGPKALTIFGPSGSENVTMFYTSVAITLSNVRAVVNGTSPSVTYSVKYGSNRSSAAGTLVNAAVVTNTTTGVNATLTATAIPAGSWIWIETSATSGTVNYLSISMEF
jgi:hypothetical protein